MLKKEARLKLLIQACVSLVLIGAGVYLIVAENNPAVTATATGWIGIVIGYWLK